MNVQGALARVDSSDCGGHGLPLPFPRRSGSRTRHPSGRGRLAGGRADRAPGRIRARDPRRFRSDQPCGVSPRTAAARPGGGGPGTGIDRRGGGSRGRFPNGNPPPAFQRPHPPVSADSPSIRGGGFTAAFREEISKDVERLIAGPVDGLDFEVPERAVREAALGTAASLLAARLNAGLSDGEAAELTCDRGGVSHRRGRRSKSFVTALGPVDPGTGVVSLRCMWRRLQPA